MTKAYVESIDDEDELLTVERLLWNMRRMYLDIEDIAQGTGKTVAAGQVESHCTCVVPLPYMLHWQRVKTPEDVLHANIKTATLELYPLASRAARQVVVAPPAVAALTPAAARRASGPEKISSPGQSSTASPGAGNAGTL